MLASTPQPMRSPLPPGRRPLPVALPLLLGLTLVAPWACYSSSARAPGDYSALSYTAALGPRAAPASPPAAPAEAEQDDGQAHNTEAYHRIFDNPVLATRENPLSTFGVVVDTASYSNVRRFLRDGALPPPDAVRLEELVNYFDYAYPQPQGEHPLALVTEVGPCPWKPAHRLVHIGLQARRLYPRQTPPRNLVFLLDVSGSMYEPRKLPLLKAAMSLLVKQLGAEDQVAIVVYAGASGLVQPPTRGDQQEQLLEALQRLSAGGSTNGGDGIRLAYAMAHRSFNPRGINRVILDTDGDFNVVTTSEGELIRLVEQERQRGVFLTVLGLGTGNLKDATMEQLADKGNGNYAYLDSLAEARKVLVREAGGTLVTVAKDVKIQVEFNPARVRAYRLLGYENRLLRAEDFNDDTKDAGEMGAGHTVTALYEIIPAGAPADLPGADPLRYQQPRPLASAAASGELSTLKLRYKEPQGSASRLLSAPIEDRQQDLQRTSAAFRFSAAVASFGMLLRRSEHRGAATYDLALRLADGARGQDPHGYRAEFLTLVRRAAQLAGARASLD